MKQLTLGEIKTLLELLLLLNTEIDMDTNLNVLDSEREVIEEITDYYKEDIYEEFYNYVKSGNHHITFYDYIKDMYSTKYKKINDFYFIWFGKDFIISNNLKNIIKKYNIANKKDLLEFLTKLEEDKNDFQYKIDSVEQKFETINELLSNFTYLAEKIIISNKISEEIDEIEI